MTSRVGELLVRLGQITPEQLVSAQQIQRQSGGLIGGAIVKIGALEEASLVETLSKQYGLPLIDLDECEIETDAAKLIPHEIAQKHLLLPVTCHNSNLTVAMADPSNIQAVSEVRFLTGFNVHVVLAPESSLRQQLERVYEGNISYERIIQDLGPEEQIELVESEIDPRALERASEDAPVVKLVNAILADAIKKGASDIHIEPYEKLFRVRFRIDGVLYEIMSPPYKLKNALTSRIKIMADLDIAERRLPQDGRIKLKLGNRREMDFRVSVLPGLFGEKIVLRLLDKGALQTEMTRLGFDESQLRHFQEAITKPYGLVLVTGPTGSGKTTTLYSALSELNKTTVNISTAEDPVEFNLPGINQVQMHEEIGLNFATALRSFLRQDPDVIMVGEIRDPETAQIAIKSSLTGHLVLSTVHTNDAPSTINRLLNMGVEPFLVSSSINIIVAQRLARRVCDQCKTVAAITSDVLERVGFSSAETLSTPVFHGTGCSKCSNTGYKGRIALYECMPMTEALKECVLRNASSAELKRTAVREGMKTLRQSGLAFVRTGITTVEEVLRVTAPDSHADG